MHSLRMANQISVTNKSSSDPNKLYTTVVDANGRIGCDCRGWTVLKNGKARECKHTKDLVKKYGIATTVQGDYYYAKNMPGGFKPATPISITDPTPTPAKKKGKKSAPKTVGGVRIIDMDDEEITPYVDPMLATPFPEGQTLQNFVKSSEVKHWAMEEKFDGHRVIVAVKDGDVQAWSRPRQGKTALKRDLPPQIATVFATFPTGTYDGELIVPGGMSTDVVDLSNAGTEQFIVFDVLRLLGEDTTKNTYDERREFLTEIFAKQDGEIVMLALSVKPSEKFVKDIWARGGEGAILKRRASHYQPGARSRDYIKIKGCEHIVMTVTGYKAGKNGPHSTVEVRAEDGSTTTVKTLDNDAIRAFDANPDAFIGRKLMIEYQLRTPDGGYRHPRWDRWENE